MNIDTILVRQVMGLLPADELPNVAVDAIQAGYDSPSLRQLAGTSAGDSDEIRRLFAKAMGELGRSLPSKPEAGLALARTIAREVLSGAIAPYEGAKQIWHRVYTKLPELERLTIFVGLASEYEDDVEHRDNYSRRIIEECENLAGGKVEGKQPGMKSGRCE